MKQGVPKCKVLLTLTLPGFRCMEGAVPLVAACSVAMGANLGWQGTCGIAEHQYCSHICYQVNDVERQSLFVACFMGHIRSGGLACAK